MKKVRISFLAVCLQCLANAQNFKPLGLPSAPANNPKSLERLSTNEQQWLFFILFLGTAVIICVCIHLLRQLYLNQPKQNRRPEFHNTSQSKGLPF